MKPSKNAPFTWKWFYRKRKKKDKDGLKRNSHCGMVSIYSGTAEVDPNSKNPVNSAMDMHILTSTDKSIPLFKPVLCLLNHCI
jgi:hypothetical protein